MELESTFRPMSPSPCPTLTQPERAAIAPRPTAPLSISRRLSAVAPGDPEFNDRLFRFRISVSPMFRIDSFPGLVGGGRETARPVPDFPPEITRITTPFRAPETAAGEGNAPPFPPLFRAPGTRDGTRRVSQKKRGVIFLTALATTDAAGAELKWASTKRCPPFGWRGILLHFLRGFRIPPRAPACSPLRGR